MPAHPLALPVPRPVVAPSLARSTSKQGTQVEARAATRSSAQKARGWMAGLLHPPSSSVSLFFFSCFRSLQWQRCTPSPSARAGGDALLLPPLFLRWPTDPPQLGWGACSASLCLKSLTPLWQPCSNRRGKGDVLPCRPSAILLQPFPGLLLQGGRRRGDGAGGEDAPGRAFEFVWSMGSQNQIAEH